MHTPKDKLPQMKIILNNIQAKPISVNKAYYKRNNQLTKEARELRIKLFEHIIGTDGLVDQLKAFREAFTASDHELHVKYTFSIPKSIYLTKKGYISRASGDVDNYIKVLNDFIFNEKYWEDESRYDFKSYNIGIDDQFITRLEARKQPSLDGKWSIDVKVSIEPLQGKK